MENRKSKEAEWKRFPEDLITRTVAEAKGATVPDSEIDDEIEMMDRQLDRVKEYRPKERAECSGYHRRNAFYGLKRLITIYEGNTSKNRGKKYLTIMERKRG